MSGGQDLALGHIRDDIERAAEGYIALFAAQQIIADLAQRAPSILAVAGQGGEFGRL